MSRIDTWAAVIPAGCLSQLCPLTPRSRTFDAFSESTQPALPSRGTMYLPAGKNSSPPPASASVANAFLIAVRSLVELSPFAPKSRMLIITCTLQSYVVILCPRLPFHPQPEGDHLSNRRQARTRLTHMSQRRARSDNRPRTLPFYRIGSVPHLFR